MKKFAAEEVVCVKFYPDAMEVLEPDRLHQLPYYEEEGYKSQDFIDHTTVYRRACIRIEIEGVGIIDATQELAPWYGYKHPTKEIADQVAEEIDAGVLDVVSYDEDGLDIKFERHSLHKEVAV